jgi:hypothetical protein
MLWVCGLRGHSARNNIGKGDAGSAGISAGTGVALFFGITYLLWLIAVTIVSLVPLVGEAAHV